MFWFISKILVPLASIWFWLIVLLVVALWMKNNKIKNKLLIICISCFLIFLNRGIVNIAFVMIEPPHQQIQAGETFDYALVLGGFAEFDRDRKTIEFNNSSDRLFSAIELYKRGVVGKILLSGGEGTLIKTGVSESSVTARYLIAIGIPKQDIVEESNSKNTFENITNCINTFDLKHKKTLLITSAYHIPRSIRICHKLCISPTPYPCDFKSSRIRFTDFLIFNTTVLNDWDIIIHETIGLMIYWIMGYI